MSERLAAALADRYRLERELGQGGMATVYLAQDLRHDRKVALKVLKPDLAAVLGAERFVVEIRTTAQLQHPHILPLFDSGTADGFLYYVMPYVQGETLRSRLDRERQLGIDEAVRIAREVADALDYAHRHGVVHRDIKPENLLLHDGRPMVADFGIALAVSAAAGGRMTETGLSLGTPHYMSPEQATADREITGRSDIYSLGSVLYEMLTGEPPHLGTSAQQIIMKIVADTPRPVTELRKSVPPHVAQAVAQALEKLPADRFASAREFADALVNPGFVRAAALPAGSAGSARRSWIRDPRTWVAAAALGGAALILALRPQRGTEQPPPGLVVTSLLPNSGETWIHSGSHFAISPEGSRLAVVALTTDNPRGHLVIRALDSLRSVALRRTEGARFPFWSPHGASLAFFADGWLKVVDPGSGGVRNLCPAVDPRGGTWGSRGDILFSARGRGLQHVTVAEAVCRELSVAAAGRRVGGRPYFLDDGLHFMTHEGGAAWIGRLGEDTLTHLTNLTPELAAVAPPSYLLTRGTDGGLYAQLIDVRRRALTGNPMLVLDGVSSPAGQTAVSASASGSLVAAGPGAELRRRLAFVTRGTGATELIPMDQRDAWFLRFSRTGRYLALSGWGLWIMDLESRTIRRAAAELDTGRVVVAFPIWGPADSVLTFRRGFRDLGQTLYDPRNDRAARWFDTAVSGRSGFPTDWSHDGRVLLIQTSSGPEAARSEIWVREVHTGATELLISERGDVADARFSPDGRWIAYRSDADGSDQIYLRPYPGPGAPVRVSSAGGERPRWRADGRELYYTTFGGGVMAVTVAADGRTGAPTPAFPETPALRALWGATGGIIRDFEPAPDGQRFVLFLMEGEASGFTLVQNWRALLERAR